MTCHNCQFWSDKIARFSRNKLQAMCLNDNSPKKGMYTAGTTNCGGFSSGEPIDLDDDEKITSPLEKATKHILQL